jgi:hypothetical protein
MMTTGQVNTIIARLRGMECEAEMKRQYAALKGNMQYEYRYQGERAGLLKALDLLQGKKPPVPCEDKECQHNADGVCQGEGLIVTRVPKAEVMGNGCE